MTDDRDQKMMACALALDAEHIKAEDVDGCVMCWPADSHWPCLSRRETDELLDLLAGGVR